RTSTIGGGVYANNGTLTLQGDVLAFNQARQTATGGAATGGADAVDERATSLVAQGDLFYGNLAWAADGQAGGAAGPSGGGGAARRGRRRGRRRGDRHRAKHRAHGDRRRLLRQPGLRRRRRPGHRRSGRDRDRWRTGRESRRRGDRGVRSDRPQLRLLPVER